VPFLPLLSGFWGFDPLNGDQYQQNPLKSTFMAHSGFSNVLMMPILLLIPVKQPGKRVQPRRTCVFGLFSIAFKMTLT